MQQNLRSMAASLVGLEAENGTLYGPVTISNDAQASNGTYIVLMASASTPTPQPQASSQDAYFVDCNAGNDANNGTTTATAWKTLSKASSSPMAAGKQILLKRGCTWNESLTISASGDSAKNIMVGAYGTGNLPVIQRNTNGSIVIVKGSYITIENIYAKAIPPTIEAGCGNNPKGNITGFSFESGAANNTLRDSKASGAYAGVFLRGGSHHNKILKNVFENNTMMSPLDTSANNDAGAFGVLIWGDDNEIANNQMSGHDACSYDYGRDGSAVELYGGQRNNIHHNISHNDDAFSELGNSRTADTTYTYNLYTSSNPASSFIVLRGADSQWGPTLRTKIYNNTAYLTGSSSQGFVCHGGCSSSILSLYNNIIYSPYKVGYADAGFDEGYNLFWGGVRQFSMSSTSKVADPQFVSAGSDFHLKSSSPAVNAGKNLNMTVDLDGKSLPAGSVVDIGAYEL